MRGSIRDGSLRGRRRKEEVNPMDGMANLADAMLVLACGLMMALMIHWNVDVNLEKVDLNQGAEVSGVESQTVEQVLDEESSYQRMGILYRDPETGKLYMLTEESGEAAP